MNDINIFDFFLKSSGLAKLTMLILIYLSITSWSIIIHRSHILISATRKASMFEDKFWFDIKLSRMELYRLYQEKQTRGESLSGSEKIFYAGFQEFTRLHLANNYDPDRIVEGAARAMRIAMNRELEALETHIPFLGTVGSISPYIGLFGTVWGILHTFIGLSTVKNPTLQIVAPGIAEALITTAIGLFASIPAVIAFNRLNLQVNKLEQRYDNFIEELIATLYSQALVKTSAK